MTRFDGPLSGDKITVISADGPDVTIQDSDLLFEGHYSRSGHDLVITGDHGNSVVVLDYFSQPDMPALSSAEGATLQPHVVNALAGPMTPGQYAQAGDQQPADSIGKVVTLEGSATAQRTDGTVIQLNVGDQLAQGDVLQTADGSALGLVFIDGTVFSLTGASRMVLDNLVYQSGGSNNSLSFDVVQGTFSFVTGQVAPTGEMRIETPVASLGIRGTTPGGICANGGPCTFFIAPDPGTTRVGEYVLVGNNGQILQTVNNPNVQYVVSSDGGLVEQPLDPSLQEVINKLIAAYEQRQTSIEEENDDTPDDTQNANASSGGLNGEINIDGTPVSDMAINDTDATPDDGSESEVTEPGEGEAADAADGQPSVPETSGPTIITQPPPPSVITASLTEDGSAAASGSLGGNVVPQAETVGEFGSFSVDADGVWTYTLNNSSPAVQALGQGQSDTDSFTVTRNDGGVSIVTITVNGTNDAPVAVADSVGTEFESSTTFTAAELLANDTDIDNPVGDLSIAGVTNGIGGIAVLNLDGSVTFTPDEGFSGTATFTYTVTDGAATSAPVTVSVTVEESGTPVASPVTLTAIAEDSGARIITQAELLAGVTDPDGPSLTITALSIATGSGSLVDNEDGTWTYTPAANDDTGVTFNYTASDGSSSSSSTASLDITPVNDAPVASPVTLTASAEDSGARIITQAELLAGVTDLDGPSLTITALSIASGSGSLVSNGDGTWTYTPASNDDTGVTFNYTASDGTTPVSSTASLDLTPVNDAPSASPVTLTAIAEDSGARIITQAELLAGVTDPDGPSLTITALSIASGSGSLVSNGDGTWTYTPASNDDTGVTFNYTLTDGTTPVSSTASLDLTPVNDAPTASPVTLTAIAENSGGRIITQAELLAGVSDPDGPSLTITALTIATGGGSLVNNGNGTWTYTPAENDDTGVTFNYTVTDGTTPVSSTASLDITSVNEPPVLTGDLEADIANDDSYILTTDDLGFTDSDDTTAVFTVSNLVNGSILVDGETATTFTYADIQNGLVSFVHDGSETSQAYFDVSVEDGNEDGSTPESQTFTLHVTNYITGTEGPDTAILNGTEAVDVISGLGDNDTLTGNGDDDTLIGGAGADTYVWADGDGYDTIIGDNLNQDVVRIEGEFYDYNFQIDGDDLLIGVAADGDYEWSDVGGNLRIQNFFNNGDTIAYLEADLGDLNDFYNPQGEGADTRIYFSAVNGTDQGNYYEVILGTDAGETLTDIGDGGINRMNGYGGNDVLNASDSPYAGKYILVGGDGDDELNGGANDDELRGGAGDDDMDGGDGYDTLAYHRPASSGEFTHGVFVNLSDTDQTFEFAGGMRTVAAGTALDNWWDPGSGVGVDTISNVESVLGTQFDDIIIGGSASETIAGGDGADILDGGVGEGYDQVSFYPPFGSPSPTQGVFVNISTTAVTYDFNGELDITVGPGQALDNWGNTDTLSNFNDIAGSDLDDVLVAGDDDNFIFAGAGDDIIAGGGGYNYLVGGEGSDSFVFGEEWSDTEIGLFELNTDVLRFQGDVGIASYEVIDAIYDEYGDYDSTLVTLTSGATVLLYGVTDIEDVSQLTAPPLLGNSAPNAIDGTVFNDVIEGGQGNDTLNGRAGVDTYVWNAGDGDDTIVGDDASQDIIAFQGSFYDFSWEYDGNDLIIGVVADDSYVFDGSIRIQDFTAGGDSISYLEADLDTGPENYNEYYSPDRGGEISRIYLSAIDGIDQGNDFELVVGTSGNDTMTDAGGTGLNRFDGRDGDDTITGSSEGRNVLQGGNGNDTLTGGDFNDQFRSGNGNDIINGGDDEGEFGGDLVRYDRNAGSGPYTHGVVVNLSDESIILSGDPGEGEYFFEGMNATVASNQVIGNWENLATWVTLPANRVDTDTLSGIESVRGSTFDDILIGSDGDNNIIGDQGDDTIIAGDGYDFIVASFGSDYIDGGDGDYDQVWYEELDGVEINLEDGYADEGGGVVDILVNIESISGSRGADILVGDGGDNILQGLGGDDYLDGAGGFDSIEFYSAPAGVIVDLGAGTASDGYGYTDTFVGIEGILGSFHDDTLTGTNSNNYIDGRDGHDIIRGYGGNDNLVGGEGSDIFVFGDQNIYTDTAQIEDFVVGEDYLRLEDGVSLNDIEDWTVADLNGDDILDTRITIIDAGDFEDGYIDLLGVSGVTDVNDLLEPPSFFSMAFMAPEGDAAFDTQMVPETGAVAPDVEDDDAGGLGESDQNWSSQERRGGEGRGFELAFAQVAAAVAGSAFLTSVAGHAAEVLMPHTESELPEHSAGSDHDWAARIFGGHSFNSAAAQTDTANTFEAGIWHKSSLAEIHGALDFGGLRGTDEPTPHRSSGHETGREWSGAKAFGNSSHGPRISEHAARDGNTHADAQSHTGDLPAAQHGWHEGDGVRPDSADWLRGAMLDGAPILDFSNLPVGGDTAQAFLKGAVHQIEIKLPAFESVIDLRHDLFAELPAHQNAAGKGLELAQDIRGAVGEWAHAAVADFVHNMANDLEAAAQNHDAR